MLNKKRIIAVLTGIALLLTITGMSGVVADSVGLSVTMPAHACNPTGGSGGGC